MGEKTRISWCDMSFNPWWGCTKVGPGCDACYAEAWDNRVTAQGQPRHWGSGIARRYFDDKHWNAPRVWHRKAVSDGVRRRVFCASMADVFDNEVEQSHRDRLWNLIRSTPMLTWLLVTKRIGNAAKMLPADWTAAGPGYANVWLIATTVNQEELDRDGPKLLAIPAAIHGLSVEPMLGPLDLSRLWLKNPMPSHQLSWVICGGESRQPGHEPRVMYEEWAESLRDQCQSVGIAFHMKQAGAILARQWRCKDPDGKDPGEWPQAFNLQQFPQVRP